MSSMRTLSFNPYFLFKLNPNVWFGVPIRMKPFLLIHGVLTIGFSGPYHRGILLGKMTKVTFTIFSMRYQTNSDGFVSFMKVAQLIILYPTSPILTYF